jgi:hypothetical protein
MCRIAASHPDASGTCQSQGGSLDGSWGADDANLTVNGGHGSIEFGCGSATIDQVDFQSDGSFTATGTHSSGLPFAPGHGPAPSPATYKGSITDDGKTLTLEMTFDGSTTKDTFTKDRKVTLFHCL